MNHRTMNLGIPANFKRLPWVGAISAIDAMGPAVYTPALPNPAIRAREGWLLLTVKASQARF